jgi:hypothetical protein
MLEKVRFTVVIATIWLAAVTGVSGTAWFAIDQAGRDVSDAGVSSLRPIQVGTGVATTSPDSGPSQTAPTRAPTPSQTAATRAPSPSRTAPTGAPSPLPAPSARRGPSPIPARSAAPSRPKIRQTRPVSSTRPQDRTLTIFGGQVSVRCTAATITLRIAQPDDGWRVKVDKSGPQEVGVRFQRTDGNSGRGTGMTAVCLRGTPVFRVDNKG